MEVHGLARMRANDDPFRARVSRLIELVGTPRFESEMFEVAHEATNTEHLTAFAVCDLLPPRVLLATNTGGLPVAKNLAQKYVSHYWKLDPANKAAPAAGQCGGAAEFAIRILPDDIADSSYRQDCYTAVRLQDRFSLIQPRGGKTYRLNFYRASGKGRFLPSDIERIMNSADLLLSLLFKHDQSGQHSELRAEAYRFADRLRLIEPSMPPRETEVCAAIMLGMTSEAISLMLGISINTVLTYRKRGYSRLGISSQNELLRLILR